MLIMLIQIKLNRQYPDIPYKTGDVELKDINRDEKITFGQNTVDDPGDRRVIGNSNPRYQFGLNLKC